MPESDEERRAREEKDRIYAVQRDAALASVRGGRAARSFVEAGANDHLPALHLSYSGDDSDSYELKLYDRAGALVNADDFYEFLRQQFHEVYALHHALRRHVEEDDESQRGGWDNSDTEFTGTDGRTTRTSYQAVDRVHWAFRDAYRILKAEGHFDPLHRLWPLTRLFEHMDGWALARRLDETRAKKPAPGSFAARYAHAVCERAAVPDVLQSHVLEFVGGTFLPRNRLQPILDELIYENVDRMHPEIRSWEMSLRVFCRKEDFVPVWTAPVSVGSQASGTYYLDGGGIYFTVYREGEDDDWDSDFATVSESDGGETDLLEMSDVEHEVSDGELSDLGVEAEVTRAYRVQSLMEQGLSYGDLDKETRVACFGEAFAYLEEAASLGAVPPPLGPAYGRLMKLRPKRETPERGRYEAIVGSLRANAAHGDPLVHLGHEPQLVLRTGSVPRRG